MTGHIIGHCKLNKHLKNLGPADVDLCRFYQEEEESVVYVLCQCEALSRVRFQLLGDEKPSVDLYTRKPLSNLKSLIKRIGLEKVL